MSAPATIHPAALHGAAIYRTAIAHVRRTPLRNAFTYRSYSWYVDVDHLPQLPRLLRPLAGFQRPGVRACVQPAERVLVP